MLRGDPEHSPVHAEGCARAQGWGGNAQDGRDVPDGTSIKFVEQLQSDLAGLKGVDAQIASGGGRMYVTMDRYEVTSHTACISPRVYVTMDRYEVTAHTACTSHHGPLRGDTPPTLHVCHHGRMSPCTAIR